MRNWFRILYIKPWRIISWYRFFKEIVISLSKALKTIHEKGIMHRDIKQSNIFIKSEEDKKLIKLRDFGCSIFIKDNTSEPLNTSLIMSQK